MDKRKNFSITGVIYSSKESTWSVLLSAQLYQTIWGAKLKTTWQPGTSVEFKGVWENVDYTDMGVVLINKENRLLKYSYWSSFWEVADTPDEYCDITYSINPLDSFSCELTIAQDGFRDEKHYSDTVELWKSALDTIKLESEKFDLSAHCHSVFDNLLSTFDSISDESYNKPVSSGWNIAQVVEHIILGNSGLKQFLTEASADPSNEYDVNIQKIKSMMLNTTDKLKTVNDLVPPFKKYDKKHHRDLLLSIQKEINDCVNTLALRAKCTLEMQPFGLMSIFEWLNFCVFHISRHTRQIESIRRTVL
jgi:hypothetical protein